MGKVYFRRLIHVTCTEQKLCMDLVDNCVYVKRPVIYTPVYESIYVEETVSSISL